MVDMRKVMVLLLTLFVLTGCDLKREQTVYSSSLNNVAYVNEGNTTTTTTEPTTTTTTTRKVEKTTNNVAVTNNNVSKNTSYTNTVLNEAKNNVVAYKDMIDIMIASINRYRAEEGLKPLKYDYQLCVAASVRAAEMALTDVFEHTRPDGAKWSTVYGELNIYYNRAAENIAFGFNDIERSMTAFMNSPTHRKNIMNPDLEYVGIGIAPTGNTYYFAQEFKA